MTVPPGGSDVLPSPGSTDAMLTDEDDHATLGASQASNLRISQSSESAGPGTRYSGRIGGLDVARTLAIFGMFYAHVAPQLGAKSSAGSDRNALSLLLNVPNGRSSILFALMAGISLAILTGRNVPYSGERMRAAKMRIAGRSLVLLILGSVMALCGTSISIILSFYACWFIASIPFASWTPRKLLIMAAVTAILGPILRLIIIWFLGSIGMAIGADGKNDFFLWTMFIDGSYPGIVYMSYIFAGMAIGRSNIVDKVFQRKLVISGCALMIFGYGISWILTRYFGIPIRDGEGFADTPNRLSNMEGASISNPSEISEAWGLFHWQPLPFPEAWEFASAEPHSNTAFEALGSGGFAIAVVGLCLLFGRLARTVLYPLAATGTMALTAYVAHILVVGRYPGWVTDRSWGPFLWLVIGSMIGCVMWRFFFARGPLEWATWKASMLIAGSSRKNAVAREARKS